MTWWKGTGPICSPLFATPAWPARKYHSSTEPESITELTEESASEAPVSTASLQRGSSSTPQLPCMISCFDEGSFFFGLAF